jgi:recombination DNA repair RAD52 pathway protein
MDIEALKAPLDKRHVMSRVQGKTAVYYITAWHAIAEANRIFGFDGWTRETVSTVCVSERERKIGKGQYEKDGWGVTYTAKVQIRVFVGTGDVVREGTGAGHGIDADCGQAHESAIKEAESDAMKRALMTFGNPFGLALYDKTQANVEDAGEREARERFEQIVDAKIAHIGEAVDAEMLKAIWLGLERSVQHDARIIAAKDNRKSEIAARASTQ